MRSSIRPALLAVLLLGAVPAAEASPIVLKPPTVVDNGTFVSDLISGLDWYKFSNLQTTVYRSYNEVVSVDSPFMADGWRVAELSEVNGFWSRFGWVADTPYSGITENAGLADALIGAVGATFISFDPSSYDSRGIVARYAGTLNEAHDTTWVYRETHADPSVEVHLDFVSSSWGWVGDNVANNYGTWLVRDHVVPEPVPEPASLLLLGTGLVGLAGRAWRKR